jgi:hypothetical protein
MGHYVCTLLSLLLRNFRNKRSPVYYVAGLEFHSFVFPSISCCYTTVLYILDANTFYMYFALILS